MFKAWCFGLWRFGKSYGFWNREKQADLWHWNWVDIYYGIFFEKKGVNAVNVKVNGIDCGSIMCGHLMCDLSDALCKGENID